MAFITHIITDKTINKLSEFRYFIHLISLSYKDIGYHSIKIYYLKHLKNRSYSKKVFTQTNKENLIIMIDLKFSKNVKTEFS